MPIMQELIVSIIGGVATAMILALFTGRGGRNVQTAHQSPSARERRGRSMFGDLIRLIVAVCVGVAIALVGGRILINAGLLPRGLPSRLGLLVIATAVMWLLLTVGRRR